jgi:beta-lactamase regulating signal transducer with metallopeptidase domain
MNTLLALAQNAFEWTWKTSVSAGLLVALVFLAQKLLSRWLTPRLRYTLSLLIVLRLLFPALPSSPLSWENLFRPRTAPTLPASVTSPPGSTTVAGDSALPTGISPGISIGGGTKGTKGISTSISAATSTGIAHVSTLLAPSFTVRARISLAWASGFLCLMTLAGWRYQQWTRLIAQGQPVSDPSLLGLLDSARADMGVRRPVKMVVVERLGSPAVFGIWRVCLLLPQSAVEHLSAEELRMVFLHEMAHVRRHDAGLNFLLIALQFLHWFNPLIWLAAHRIRADRELVCDAMTLRRLPAAEGRSYGRVLLKLMEGFSAETPVFPGAVPVVGSKQEIKRRLIMIKQQRQGSIGAGLATALAVAALACATFTRAQERAAVSAGWTNWNNGQNIGSFYAVAGTAKETVAVGIGGHISTRDNATGKWTIQTFPEVSDCRGIVYAGNQYVVVCQGGHIMTSPDGLKWTSRTSSTKENLLGVFWDGHQYLAGGDSGTILSSPDGIKWTSRKSGSDISFYSFAYSGARYVAVGNDGICISSNSITWTPTATRWETARIPFTACVWTGAEFLACGLGLDKFPTIYTSRDGDVWRLRDTTIKASLRAAAAINGTIYVAGDSVIGKSTDGGTTWADIYTNTGGNKLFMGLASNGADLIAAGFNHNVWAIPESVSASAKGTPSTALAAIEDFHLVQTQIGDASGPGVPLESLTAYVLDLHGPRPQIFKTIDSKPMEDAIGNLPRGSFLYYDGNALMKSPPDAQLDALRAFCQTKGINFIVSPTN